MPEVERSVFWTWVKILEWVAPVECTSRNRVSGVLVRGMDRK